MKDENEDVDLLVIAAIADQVKEHLIKTYPDNRKDALAGIGLLFVSEAKGDGAVTKDVFLAKVQSLFGSFWDVLP